jgi:hypothetical protein
VGHPVITMEVLMGKQLRALALPTALTATLAAGATGVAAPAGAEPNEADVGATWRDTTAAEPSALPTLEEAAAQIGWSEASVQQFRAGIAQRFNGDLESVHGPLTAEMQDLLDTQSYFSAEDLRTYVLPPSPEGEIRLVTVRAGMPVDEAGNVNLQEPQDAAYQLAPPEFSGDWLDLDFFPHSFTVQDNPGIGELCTGPTVGEMRARIYFRELKSTNDTTYDYWGFHKSSVAEIIQESPGCFNYVDTFRTALQGLSPQEYVGQGPGSLQGTDCTTTNVSASLSAGPVSGGISKSFDRCERWDVFGYLEDNMATPFGLDFDNNSSCSNSDRVAELAVIEREPADHLWSVTSGFNFDPDQDPKDPLNPFQTCPG